MAKEKKFDAVTIVGLLLAVAILIGGNMYISNQNQQRRIQWEKDQAALLEKQKREQATAPVMANADPKTDNAPKANDTNPVPENGGTQVSVEAEPAPTPDITVDSGELTLVFSAQGGSVRDAKLPQEVVDPLEKNTTKGLEILTEFEQGRLSMTVPRFEAGPPEAEKQAERQIFDTNTGPLKAPSQRVWKLESDSGGFDGAGTRTIVYSTTLGNKYKLTKTYTVAKGERHVALDLGVTNISEKPITFAYRLLGPAGVLLDGPKNDPKANHYAMIRAVLAGRDAAANGREPDSPDVKIISTSNAAAGAEKNTISREENLWGTVKNRFYMAMLISRDPSQLIRLSAIEIKHRTGNADLRLNEPTIGIEAWRRESGKLDPGQTQLDRYALYVGPTNEEHLEKTEASLKPAKAIYLPAAMQYYEMMDSTWPRVDWIARKFMWVFKTIYSGIGSYGIAVILLTILIKISLHPTQRKMMVSMNKMQKLQPEMKKIQDKYKNQTTTEAKQRMFQETQDLYRRAGANPAGGCLPMLIQIPVLSALYGIFSHAFEIRGAEFLWIRDLSQPDMVAHLGMWPHQLNLLPIIYLGLQLLQMKVAPQAPKSDDPQAEMNRKMMMFMPIMLTFMFYSMPAGLMLYFAVSAIFGIFESWYIRKHIIKDDGSGATPTAPSGRPPPAVVNTKSA